MTDAGWTKCAECGMGCKAGDYHPYAACLMFKACHDSETVMDNLRAIGASTYHQGRVAGLKEAEKVAREWPWDRGPAHTNPLHVAKRKGERGASWCIAENIQSMIPLEQQAQGGGE